jgi:hypothetical protein
METGFLSSKIEANLKVPREKKRDYIGASQIGSPCMRQTWYEVNGELGLPVPPKLQRTFEIGKRLEGLVISVLEEAGFSLIKPDEFNHYLDQFDKDVEFFRGHCDAILVEPNAILEIKTANDSSFNLFVKKGLKSWSPRYYSQLQAYMGMSEINLGNLICINKDTSELHDEFIKFDPSFYEEMKQKAISIKESLVEPPKVNNSPYFFLCRMCKFREECHK